MSNIVKYRLEEKIRFLLLRYPKDLDKVAKEASIYAGRDVPVSVVTKVLEKFRKSQGKDIRLWVACNLAQQIIQGAQERLAKLEAMYQYWDGKEEALESVCCSAPVTKHEPMMGSPYYRCVQCNVTCGTRVIRALELENLKLKLIKDMRQESAHLIKFAKEMGFVATQPDDNSLPPAVNKNYIFVDNSNKSKKDSSSLIVDAEMAQQAENMSPMEREKLLHQLDQMLEAEFTESEKGKIEQSGK